MPQRPTYFAYFQCGAKQIHIRYPSCYNHYGFVSELYCSLSYKVPSQTSELWIAMSAGRPITAKRHQRRREVIFVSCAVFSAKIDKCTILMFSPV